MAGAVRAVLCGARRRSRPLLRDDGRPSDPGRPRPARRVAASGADPLDRRRSGGVAFHGAAVRVCGPLRRARRGGHRIEHSAPAWIDARHRHLRPSVATSARHLQFLGRSREGRAAGARRGAAADPRLAVGAGPYGGARRRPGGRLDVAGTGGARHHDRPGGRGRWRWPRWLRHPHHDRRPRYGDPHGVSALSALPHPRAARHIDDGRLRPRAAVHRGCLRKGDVRLAGGADGDRPGVSWSPKRRRPC